MAYGLPTYPFWMYVAYIGCFVIIIIYICTLIIEEIAQYIFYAFSVYNRHVYVKKKQEFVELQKETLQFIKAMSFGWYVSAWVLNDQIYFYWFHTLLFMQILIYALAKHLLDIFEYVVENEPVDIKNGNLNFYLNEKYGWGTVQKLIRESFELVSFLLGLFFFYFFIFGVCLAYKEFYKSGIPYGIYWVPPLQIFTSIMYTRYWNFLDKNYRLRLYHKNCMVSFISRVWCPFIFIYAYSYLLEWAFWAELHNIFFWYFLISGSIPAKLTIALFIISYALHLKNVYDIHVGWSYNDTNNYGLHLFLKEVLYPRKWFKCYIKFRTFIYTYLYTIFFILNIIYVLLNLFLFSYYYCINNSIILINKIFFIIYIYLFICMLIKETPNNLFVTWFFKSLSVFFLIHNETIIYNSYYWVFYWFFWCCAIGPYSLAFYLKFNWGKSIVILLWLGFGMVLNKYLYIKLLNQLLSPKCKVKPFDSWRIWRIYIANTKNTKRFIKFKKFMDKVVKFFFICWSYYWLYPFRFDNSAHAYDHFWKYATIIMFFFVVYETLKIFLRKNIRLNILNQIDNSLRYSSSYTALAARWSPWLLITFWLIDLSWQKLLFPHHPNACLIAIAFYTAIIEFFMFFSIFAHQKRAKALRAFLIKYRWKPSIYDKLTYIEWKNFCKECLYSGLSGLACLWFVEYIFAYYNLDFTIWAELFFILLGIKLRQIFDFYCGKYEKYGLKWLAWYSYWFAKDPNVLLIAFTPFLYRFSGTIFFNKGAYLFVEHCFGFLTAGDRWYLVKFLNIFAFLFYFYAFYCGWEVSEWTRYNFFHKREGKRFDYDYLRKVTYRYFIINDLGLWPYLYNIVTKTWIKSFFWRRVVQTFFQLKVLMFLFYSDLFNYDITWAHIRCCAFFLFIIQLFIWIWKKRYPNCAARLKFHYFEFLFCNSNYFDIWYIGCLVLFFPLRFYIYGFIASIFITLLIRPFYFHNTKWENVYLKTRNYLLVGFEIDYLDNRGLVFEEDDITKIRKGFRTKDLLYKPKIKKYITIFLDWLVWLNSVVLTFGIMLNFYQNIDNLFWIALIIHIFMIGFWYLFREFWKIWFVVYYDDIEYYVGDFFHNLRRFKWVFYFVHFFILLTSLSFGKIYGIMSFFELDTYIFGQPDAFFYTWCLGWLISIYFFHEEPKVINKQFHWWFTFFFKNWENWAIQKIDFYIQKIIKRKKWIYRFIGAVIYYHFFVYINYILFCIALVFLIIFILYREK